MGMLGKWERMRRLMRRGVVRGFLGRKGEGCGKAVDDDILID